VSDLVPIAFDRATGRYGGASMIERGAAFALWLGSRVSTPFAHLGYARGANMVARLLHQRDIVVRLNEDAQFAFPFGDGYWSRLLDRSFVYEPDLECFLRGIADVDYTLADCGANFGLWSVLASSAPYGRHKAVAVEAAAANFAKLAENARLNGNRFNTLHRAIAETTGETVRIEGSKHEALAAVADGAGASGEKVTTISLDGLIGEGHVAPDAKLVVKLDVEGMEIAALKGGQRMLAGDTVVVYEEHGSDRAHTATRFILSETPCRVFAFESATGTFAPLTDVATLDRVKQMPWIGYNVLATSSPFWEERLHEMSGA